MNTKTLAPQLRLGRLLCDLAEDHLHGENQEALQEFAHQAGIEHPDGRRPMIPFDELARDLTVDIAGVGGFLVGGQNQDVLDILRPWSVVARAGIQLLTNLTGDVSVPKVTGKATPKWLETETAEVPTSTPALQEIALTPKTVGILIQLSRRLMLQTDGEKFARRELLRSVGTAIDQACINGSGADGEPLGLLDTPGVNTEPGAAFSHASAAAMKRVVAAADASDEEISFLSTPAVRELLETRERASGSGYIWDHDHVASRPGFVSTDVPSDTLIAGAWPRLLLGLWGRGITLEVNPFDATAFKRGGISVRALVSVDVGVLHPAAFALSVSIT